MRTVRTHFEEVELFMDKRGTCAVCGKRRRRRKRFWQTVNPWNVTTGTDSRPKTREEIRAELFSEAKAWASGPFRCATCEGAEARDG